MKGIENPIAKMIKDQERIREAIKNNIPLSSLSDIKFIHPIEIKNKKNMGVDITQYFLIGLKVNPDKYYDKLCTDEVYDNDNKLDDYLSVVYDGMGGDYLFIGHVIEEEDEYNDLDFFNNGFTETVKKYKKEIKKVKTSIKKYLLPEDAELISNVDVFYIKHYS